MTVPLVSAVIPYYEGGEWLEISAASVLSQEGCPFELIVVDDGSASPPACACISDPRVRFERIRHSGKGAALNRGVSLARGEFICFVDQDDVVLPGRFALQSAALSLAAGAGGVYSDYELADEGGGGGTVLRGRAASCAELLHEMAAGRGLVSIQNLMLRRSTLLAIGGFSEDSALTGLDDAEFFARLFSSGAGLEYVPGTVSRWLSHGGNYSKGRRFQDARLALLDRLEHLGENSPMIKAELGSFRAHALEMRGIYFLENCDYAAAFRELRSRAAIPPFSLNACYLLLKAAVMRVSGGKGGV